MKEIRTSRLILRPFRESDYNDLYEFLSQLENDEFEGYPGITRENGREHLEYRMASDEFYALELADSGKVIGNVYCGNREIMRPKRSAVSSTGITGEKGMPARRLSRSSQMHSTQAPTGFSRNVIPGTPAPGNCLKRPV